MFTHVFGPWFALRWIKILRSLAWVLYASSLLKVEGWLALPSVVASLALVLVHDESLDFSAVFLDGTARLQQSSCSPNAQILH